MLDVSIGRWTFSVLRGGGIERLSKSSLAFRFSHAFDSGCDL